MSDESLKFSFEDLGRLAAFLTTQGDRHSLHAIMEWIDEMTYYGDDTRSNMEKIITGYREEIQHVEDKESQRLLRAVG